MKQYHFFLIFFGSWKLEVGSWKLEVGSWKLEVGSLEVGGWRFFGRAIGYTINGLGVESWGCQLLRCVIHIDLPVSKVSMGMNFWSFFSIL